MQVVAGGINEQATQAFTNLKAVVEASGSTMDKVVKTTASDRLQNFECAIDHIL